MPAWNSALFIREAIESVRAQTLDDWELLVVDDCSSDSTAAVVRDYVRYDKRVVLFRQPRNLGPASTRNRAIEAGKGRFVAFLDADDAWRPTKLERQMAFMQEKGAAFSFTAYERMGPSGERLDAVGVPERVTYAQLLRTPYVGCLTAMYDREALGLRKMPDIPRRQDYALWLDLLRDGTVGFGLNEVLARYRIGHTSVSSNKLRAAADTWRVYRRVERLPLAHSAYVFFHYALGGVLRHHFPGLARRVGALHVPSVPRPGP